MGNTLCSMFFVQKVLCEEHRTKLFVQNVLYKILRTKSFVQKLFVQNVLYTRLRRDAKFFSEKFYSHLSSRQWHKKGVFRVFMTLVSMFQVETLWYQGFQAY